MAQPFHKSALLQSLERGNQCGPLTVREQFVLASLAGVWSYHPKGVWQWCRYLLGMDYTAIRVSPSCAAAQAIAIADEAIRQLRETKG